ncbi:MAG: DEAD/DEAH box helicase family protein, partial [Acholeplasmataceae bacterium]
MKDYTNVKFKGEFRHYQQRVLEHADDFLSDGKIHIVAAPGSGKTTLGLELVKRLNEPALVFTPTITIRGQWGHRLETGFLENSENIEDYISYDLKNPSLITSVTYQALHSAYKKLVNTELDDETNEEVKEDYTKYNLISSLKKNGIKTICLDEAHHLRNEWYIALTSVIKKLGDDIKIIALTATPPYDSSQQEWAKYEELCGEIDEEIFVPELIQKKALCPHQDYVYFNYPTKDEMALLNEYKQNVSITLNELIRSKEYKTLLAEFLDNHEDEKYQFYQNIEIYITLIYLSKHAGYKIPYKLFRLVKGSRYIKKIKPNYIEDLFGFIIKNEDIFTNEISKYFRSKLNENGLLERGRVSLDKTSRIKKRVISSIGKLESIAAISKFEYNQLKDSLQMVILTDYIKKDYVQDIGTSKKFTSIGTVPIFEKVRTSLPNNVRICLLSGTLVIIPNTLIDILKSKADKYEIQIDTKELPGVEYSIVSFKGNNKKKVFILTT